ncbi:glycosyltransferase [Aquabacterium sp.]|uniref:glycosyltransferase n=1 Tax=Aquabacterium sp. TaxID=1872578 RepID=UPI00378302DB
MSAAIDPPGDGNGNGNGASVAMRGPLVSVLIRSMDRDTLADALAAVAAQRADDIEVLVVNAGGRPHRPLPGACGRFALRLVEPADGAALPRAAAANLALERAAGDWLLFLDDDDLIDADHIARLREALARAPGRAVAYAGVRLLDAQGQPAGVLDEAFDACRLWFANYLPIHAVMFSRALVQQHGLRFDESFEVYEDWDFWHQLAAVQDFLHVPGTSASYRLIGASGLSAGRDAAMTTRARQAIYRKWLPQLSADKLEGLAAAAERWRAERVQHSDAREAAERALMQQQALATERLDQLQRQRDSLAVQLADSAEQLRSLKQQAQHELASAQAYQQQLEAHVKSAERDYRVLEQGYRQVTGSLSWRITAPLRALRSAAQPEALRRAARATLRRTALALPVSPQTRQRIKVWLAGRAWAAPLLRWLAPPAPPTAAGEGASPQPPALDKEAVRADAEQALTQFLASGRQLRLPVPAGAPRVSVIVVLFNQAGLSLQCLQALADSRGVDFETLVVDNASSDRVPQLLERVSGARLLPQRENLGFLRAVNLAAAEARGEYLLLLNNDALVEPDTLAHAVARLDGDPRIGAVGGPILLWDGRLQEAGSIIWRDGSCLGYGRGESPDAGPYRFLREVDYCSGAFLLLRRERFASMGGFDDAYAPAYYEESDLCARLWEAGQAVVFDPKVRIRHFEFASDDGQGRAIALQARNRLRFAEKHPAFLAARPAPDLARLLQARQRLPAGARRVLFIDDRVPMPWLGQGYPRAASFVAAIVAGGDFVTHYPLQFPHEHWDDVRRALPESVEVMLDEGLAGIAGFLAARAGFYDLMVISRPHNMDVINALRANHPAWFEDTLVVYDAEALFSVRDIAKAALQGQALPAAEQQQMIRQELALARGADRVVAVSEAEARHYRQTGFADVQVLGHALAQRPVSVPLSARSGFLFIGAVPFDDSPNGDSLIWFIQEVWPLVVQDLGEAARLDIVGPCESATLRALAGASIRIHGQVPSVEPFQDAARVFIVPTRYAAGIPHKAHEAAAAGLPMVVTPLIAEQLGWTEAVAVGASAQAFAEACVRLHRDDLAWQTQHRALQDLVARDCSPAAFEAAVRRIVAVPVRAAAA